MSMIKYEDLTDIFEPSYLIVKKILNCYKLNISTTIGRWTVQCNFKESVFLSVNNIKIQKGKKKE